MATNPTGEALIKAAEEGRTDEVKALLKDGTDVHAVDEMPPGPLGAHARLTPPRRAEWLDGAHVGSASPPKGRQTHRHRIEHPSKSDHHQRNATLRRSFTRPQ